MVTIFFVLSGYVLSYKLLKLARAIDHQALFKNLTSSIFRGGPRLFLPLLGPMFIAAIPTYYGFSHSPQHPMDDNAFVTSGQKSLLGDFGEIFWSWERLVNPFADGLDYPRDVPTLWTLPMEFRGSIVVFILVLALSRARPPMRMLTLLAISWYSMFHGRWDTFLFVVGIVLAELRLIRQESSYCMEDFMDDKLIPSIKMAIRKCFNGYTEFR
jgi:peptidoglycan/LPS O-acetylase OafA/YrhL